MRHEARDMLNTQINVCASPPASYYRYKEGGYGLITYFPKMSP